MYKKEEISNVCTGALQSCVASFITKYILNISYLLFIYLIIQHNILNNIVIEYLYSRIYIYIEDNDIVKLTIMQYFISNNTGKYYFYFTLYNYNEYNIYISIR